MSSQLVLNNVSLTYYNPYQIINCSESNMKTIFALNGYPGIRAIAYNATAFQIPGSATLPIAATVAANASAPCAAVCGTPPPVVPRACALHNRQLDGNGHR